jgi:hypothetical protein
MNLRMVPIDLNQNGTPRDEKLCAALQLYCEKTFGTELVIGYYRRVWAVLGCEGDSYTVMGAIATRLEPDVPIFHITPPTQDREGLKIAHLGVELAVYRLRSYYEDLGLRGSGVLIYVSEIAEKMWKRFFARNGITKASRYTTTV